ncbi:MAG TPA: LytTR family DNA-binding domain-containing protein [Puia sp.]|nr:LytTR family DNA-binding domain-containing protein [Puia sp.]
MIKAIAIDDELPALKVIENFCGRTGLVRLEKTFVSPTEALAWLGEHPVDLLFLDVNMPSLTGIELYKSLRKPTLAIFTTAYSEYALEGFNVRAVDYLLKPISFERFQQAVEAAIEQFNYRQGKEDPPAEYLFLRADYSLVKIRIADILYIEALDDYLKVHLESQKPLIARLTLKAILSMLPSPQFIRVHRSYIVPIARIGNIRNKIIYLAGEEIPLGSSYEKAVLSRIK